MIAGVPSGTWPPSGWLGRSVVRLGTTSGVTLGTLGAASSSVDAAAANGGRIGHAVSQAHEDLLGETESSTGPTLPGRPHLFQDPSPVSNVHRTPRLTAHEQH